MNLSNSKASAHLSDKVAASLAKRIINIQLYFSARLNKWFNAYSLRQKKQIAIAIALLTSIILISSSFCSFYTIPKLTQNYTSAHIGRASEFPDPHFIKRQLTDSLTKKK
ncbi:hypothetical protein [Mucilaginibacter ginkgonis]|uniref:Uncharacterized protein n=1 Tax=Mucilaginibacter ginkgonis TaxID=2682091 RepID=A0A6I4I447_9SPHI|nr:hypothetical protein [Mucilaginibacter ginkgonis]MBS1526382.1 hypothetical protein [Bacteroidota bacterium]QQL50577.1 hypothetical protein GO620_003735 [Mucilaginibacter ginkgonis]